MSWDDITDDLVKLVISTLGKNTFQELARIISKHSLFKRVDIPKGAGRLDFAHFLNQAANLLLSTGAAPEDPIFLFHCSIQLETELNFSHAMLATLYWETQDIDRAKQEARLAVPTLEYIKEHGHDSTALRNVVGVEDVNGALAMENLLLSIIANNRKRDQS